MPFESGIYALFMQIFNSLAAPWSVRIADVLGLIDIVL